MSKRRLIASVTTTAALSALITGATFSLFTDSAANNSNTFTAGTVRLGDVSTFTCGIDADNIAPGDSGACNISVTYEGSLDAWLGLTATTSGALFAGDHPLSVALPGTEADGVYVINHVSNGDTEEITIEWSFPLEAGNEYQGATGEINLNIQAVQSKNNTKDDGSGPISWN